MHLMNTKGECSRLPLFRSLSKEIIFPIRVHLCASVVLLLLSPSFPSLPSVKILFARLAQNLFPNLSLIFIANQRYEPKLHV